MRYHAATLAILGSERRVSSSAKEEIWKSEARLGLTLPPAVREWYALEDAISVLAEHSNDDPPIPVRSFAVTDWQSCHMLPFRNENQGVCTWAIILDGSDDPPVYVDVDSGGAEWHLLATTFSAYVYSCVWDYKRVFQEPALVQAQNGPLSSSALGSLCASFGREVQTHGWPGSTQHRFTGNRQAILIWSAENQADWFVAASDTAGLEAALKQVWELDTVGESLYHGSEVGKTVLDTLRGKAYNQRMYKPPGGDGDPLR